MFAAVAFVFSTRRYIDREGLEVRETAFYMAADATPLGISPWPVTFPVSDATLTRVTPLLLQLEDRRFFAHGGIDWYGLARALVHNLRRLRVWQGASTLTQQLVRNLFVYPHRSLSRKLVEWMLATHIERRFSKVEILRAYCHLVFLGPGIRGFDAALRIYARRGSEDASNADLHAALGCLREPMRTSPLVDPEAYRERMRTITRILRQPAPEGAPRVPIQIARLRKPRLARIVDEELSHCCAALPRDLRRAHTTTRRTHQAALDAACRDASADAQIAAAAGLIIHSRTGAVFAESSFVDGKETEESPSFFGTIQPGSTYKTFVLLEALEAGLPLDFTLESSPFEWHNPDFGGGRWRVRNYAHSYRGTSTLADALVCSDNTVFARLTQLLGHERVLARLRNFALITPSDKNASCALGALAQGVSLAHLCRAYACISNKGALPTVHIIRGLEFYDGTLMRPPLPSAEVSAAFSSWSALDSALKRSGFASQGRQIKGKTGTSGKSTVFAGYDDDFSYAIWLRFRSVRPEWWNKGLKPRSVLEKWLAMMQGQSTLTV